MAQPSFDLQKVKDIIEAKMNTTLATYLEACVHCGLCAETCHIYAATHDPEQVPALKAEQLRKYYKKEFTLAGKVLGGLVGAEDIDEKKIEQWVEKVYQCTMCRRCTINCPMGIDNAAIHKAARAAVVVAGKAPENLYNVTMKAKEMQSPLGITRDDYMGKLDWIEELLKEETDDPKAIVPRNKKGANSLFIPSSIEISKFPLSLVSAAKIFYAAKEDWTMSTEGARCATNFGFFLGDDEVAALMAKRIVDDAIALGVKEVITPECGHAYRVLRWEAPNWLGRPLPFEVKNIAEKMAELLKEGRIKLKPDLIKKSVTFHDPCNFARNGGTIQESRDIINAFISDFREMYPHGKDSYCCGGGGGLLSIPQWKDLRLNSGKPKVEQIKATGAELVATTCSPCRMQIGELLQHFGVNVEVTGLTDLVGEALIL